MVVAALDAQTLQAWRELRVHVLDFSEFGDASDFRGIGADQVRLGLGLGLGLGSGHRCRPGAPPPHGCDEGQP